MSSADYLRAWLAQSAFQRQLVAMFGKRWWTDERTGRWLRDQWRKGSLPEAEETVALVRDWVLSLSGGPLVSLAVATNILSALTGSASGGLTIALDALGPTYMRLAAVHGIDPALLHRVAVIGAGTLDSLPHNGAVVTLLAVCGSTHAKSYLDIVMVGIVGALAALIAVIVLGSLFGSF